MEPRIRLRKGTFSYGDHEIFSGLSLDIAPGEVLSILGPNGCGKTTLLRCLAGALKLKNGSILLNEKDITAFDTIELARNIGFVFQDHLLLPYMTVSDNVFLPLLALKQSIEELSVKEQNIKRLMEETGISDLKDKYPHLISGGEAQRVALVRALFDNRV